MKLKKEALYLILAESGLTMQEVSQKSEIAPSTVTKLVRGKGDPRPKTVGRLARALGVPVSEIVEEG